MTAPAPPTVMVPLPATAVRNPGLLTTATPVGQLVLAAGAAAITTPVGKLSAKEIADCAGLPVPFAIVKVSVDVPLIPIIAGLKVLVRLVLTTFNDAFTLPALRPPVSPLILAPLLM